jgi:tRNA(Ile)-lysidine synthase
LEKEYNPGLRSNLTALGSIMQDEEAFWGPVIQQAIEEHVTWNNATPEIITQGFNALMPAVQRRLLKNLLLQIGIEGAGYIHIEEIRRLAKEGATGSAIDILHGYRAVKGYAAVTLERKGQTTAVGIEGILPIAVPGEVQLPTLGVTIYANTFTGLEATAEHAVFGDRAIRTLHVPRANGLEKNRAFFDWEQLQKPLSVRTRRPGDKFFHVGMGYNKKVKEYFIDRKIPREHRDRVLLFTHGDDILWIVGHYVDRRYLANSHTSTILELDIREE